MKKMFFIFIVLVVMIGTIAGCGKQTSKSNESSSNNDSSSSEAGDERVKITMTSWRVEEIEAFEKLNAIFEEKYPNIDVVYAPIQATEYDSQLGTSLATDSAADMMYLRPFDLGKNIYDQGYLYELTEENVPNLKNFSDTQISIYATEDNVYGLPYIYVAYGWLYNKEIFDQYGLEEPETWDDFFAICETLKSNGVTPVALGSKDAWVLNEIVSAGNYGSFADGENWRQAVLKGEKDFTDQGFVDHLKMMDSLKPYMPDNYEGIGYMEAQQIFTIGDAAMHPAGSWEIADFEKANPDLKMGLFNTPVTKKGNTPWLGFHGGAGIGVNKNSKHIEEVLTYINWLASEEVQIMTGNLMQGLYPCANISSDSIENELAREWMNFAGNNGENYAVGWPYEKINSHQQLGASILSMENLTRMMNGELTPEEVAQNINEGISSWYEPLK